MPFALLDWFSKLSANHMESERRDEWCLYQLTWPVGLKMSKSIRNFCLKKRKPAVFVCIFDFGNHRLLPLEFFSCYPSNSNSYPRRWISLDYFLFPFSQGSRAPTRYELEQIHMEVSSLCNRINHISNKTAKDRYVWVSCYLLYGENWGPLHSCAGLDTN